MDVIAFHWVFALILFLVINWTGAHSRGFGYLPLSVLAKPDAAPAFNVFFRILAPVVGIILFAAALYAVRLESFVGGIWLVAVYYVAFRLLFNVVRGRGPLLNWAAQIVIGASTIGVSFIAYRTFIQNRATLLPDLETVANELWILIALFLFQVGNQVSLSDKGTKRRKRNFLRGRLQKFRRRFGDIIEGAEPSDVRLLAYAVLIYETFNRPWIDRLIENWLLFPLGRAKTLGPMQVTTSRRIGDRESVRLGVQKLKGTFPEALHAAEKEHRERMEAIPESPIKTMMESVPSDIERTALRRTLKDYNPDDSYVYEVMSIFDELKGMYPGSTSFEMAPAHGS